MHTESPPAGTVSPAAPHPRSGDGPADPTWPRRAFLALLVCWLVLPLAQWGTFAEDAAPFVVAGRLAPEHPDAVYAGADGRVTERFEAEGCRFVPAGLDCAEFVLPFLSPPVAVAPLVVLGALGDAVAVLVLRLLAAAAFAGGAWVLWKRLAEPDPAARVPLLAAMVVLTPFVSTVVHFGQNAPLLFASAAIGLSRTDRGRHAAGAALVWVASIATKLFPLALAPLLLVRRKWLLLGWSAALLVALAVLGALVAPASLLGHFVDSSASLSGTRVTSVSNLSVDAGLHRWFDGWRDEGGAFALALGARLAAFVGLYWWRLRDADEDVQWSYAWVALLALHTQVWWHYLAVLVPATAYAVRDRRAWWAVPGVAAVVTATAVITDDALLVGVVPPVLLGAALALPFVAARPARGTVSPAARAGTR
ncbi:MAG: DUF2029 domain-containing protein [Acidimicrobiales bacterium]|nr:DUF2029 domain-containing protein [Acidimicrobiales bacterium]MCB9373585.1 DUF2029 domain-containing protein [Microthrixaceae bacterium]